MSQLQPQPSINDARTQALRGLIERLGQLDLTPLLVYRIDSVPDGALPSLAWQFDILSPLWGLLAGTSRRRELLKSAVALHRVRGTPSAIKTALAALGFTAPVILEGQDKWGGSQYPANQGWAVCRLLLSAAALDTSTFPLWDPNTQYTAGARVLYMGRFFYALADPPIGVPPAYSWVREVPDWDALSSVDKLVVAPWLELDRLNPARPVTAGDFTLAAQVFEFFKPARALLDSVWFVCPGVADAVPRPIDLLAIAGIAQLGIDAAPRASDAGGTLAIALDNVVDPFPPIAPRYDGRYKFKGVTYGANEPAVADGPLVIDGIIHGESR